MRRPRRLRPALTRSQASTSHSARRKACSLRPVLEEVWNPRRSPASKGMSALAARRHATSAVPKKRQGVLWALRVWAPAQAAVGGTREGLKGRHGSKGNKPFLSPGSRLHQQLRLRPARLERLRPPA